MAEPLPGDVWRYDYLWRWQHDGGETEGRKRRPTAMVAVIKASDGTFLFILPITSSPPMAGRMALEVPQIERRRAGLDDIPLWVMIDEYNFDRLESSFYFDPKARVGRFGSTFHRKVLEAFTSAARSHLVKRVPRTE